MQKNKRYQKLYQKARQVLEGNWVQLGDKGEGFTRPAQGIYPYQWNWDAAFSAYGYSHYWPERAVEELRSLFKGQWSSGFLPHIIFHQNNQEAERPYFPGPHFWQSRSIAQAAPSEVATSGLTQPPVAALALWHIYKELVLKDKTYAHQILKEFYPKVYTLHQYLHTQRDPEKWGLVTIYHPWESGFDNSPRWDKPLEKVKPRNLPEYTRSDLDYVALQYRPSQANYDKYIYLSLKLKNKTYHDGKIYKDHPFKVKDITFSSILYIADQRLLYIAKALGEDTSQIQAWLEKFKQGLLAYCLDSQTKLLYDFDLISGRLLRVKTAGNFIPLITGAVPKKIADDIIRHLNEPNYCGQGACAIKLLPSVGIQEPYFQPENYWRGPIWLNVNWFLWRGLRAYGRQKRALNLAQNLLDLVEKQGFYEFYSPISGQGLGARNFSWSAAVTLEILDDLIKLKTSQ